MRGRRVSAVGRFRDFPYQAIEKRQRVPRIVDAHEDVCAAVRHRPIAKDNRLIIGEIECFRHYRLISLRRPTALRPHSSAVAFSPRREQ
jgi:hypothetical protein